MADTYPTNDEYAKETLRFDGGSELMGVSDDPTLVMRPMKPMKSMKPKKPSSKTSKKGPR